MFLFHHDLVVVHRPTDQLRSVYRNLDLHGGPEYFLAPDNTKYPRISGKTSGIVARLISMSRDELHGEAEDRRLRTRTLRLAVLSYLTIVLFLWMARILAVSGIISLPLGFSAVGAQANLVTGILFLALGPGILGMRELNRRQNLESVKRRSDTNRAK